MSTFSERLQSCMRDTMHRMRKEGTTSVSLSCFKQCVTPPPSYAPDAPAPGGGYDSLFSQLVARTPELRKFVYAGMVAACFMVCGTASAQVAKRDASGNWQEVAAAPAVHDSTTTFTYTYVHGDRTYTLPVFVGPKGGYYTWKLDGKKGIQVKVYLPKQ